MAQSATVQPFVLAPLLAGIGALSKPEEPVSRVYCYWNFFIASVARCITDAPRRTVSTGDSWNPDRSRLEKRGGGVGGCGGMEGWYGGISKLGTLYSTYENQHLLRLLTLLTNYLWFTYGQDLHVVQKVTYDLLMIYLFCLWITYEYQQYLQYL